MENKLNQKIAILGGGQLGKMLIQAGSRLGLSLSVMDTDRDFPAAFVCSEYVCGDIRNYDDVLAFGMNADVITIEIENVNIEALEELQRRGKKVFPQPEVLKVIKDKGKQKMFYEGNGFPTSEFALYKNADEVIKSIEKQQLEFPFVQKLRTDGYDGRGVEIIKSKDQLSQLFDKPSIVEELVEVDKEIAVIVARNSLGEVSTFPPVEMVFHPTANLVEYLSSPANISKELSLIADDIARRLAESLGIIGLLAVEMFVDKNNKILINEVAPRPHNSGHHTIEACVTSQYEMHLRAILDLPLGQTIQIRPAVMINLLGEPDYTGSPIYHNIEICLAKSGVYPHIYGKKETKPYRKMGHVTITGDNLEDAIETARFVQKNLKVIA
ncbi:MAG: 5-(carboxyamino)imidazole ribonucleotide synthase [Saprospiraceae bacterium]|jgi:5-(carboxyamino)imidazole ribonucleotide synthase|nr:5-(carboxyamino)imidazole ribonucleotide synthase [Saprospiraceae bacterium]